MNRLDHLIFKVREQRAEFRARAERCLGAYDREGYQIDAAACAIRERALLDAREAIVGYVEPGFEFRFRP